MSDPTQPSNDGHIRRLLADSEVVRTACDLDLLLFLHRHPRTLLTSEKLASLVGYEMQQVAASLETFLEIGLVQRTQNPNHAARMYLLVLEGSRGPGLASVLDIAATRAGRQKILHVLEPDKFKPTAGHRPSKRLRAV